jgi:hypothetical protein
MVRTTLAFFFLRFPTFDIGNSRSSLTNKTSILPKFGIKGHHFGPEPVLPTKTGPRGLISSQQYSKLWCQVSSRFKTGVVLWHPGPLLVFKFYFKYTFKMLKSSDIKFNRYISKFYTFTKWFHGKSTFLLSCVKKTNFGEKKKDSVCNFFFVFFTQDIKNVGFFAKLDVRT